jgi:hypothetical protein
VLARPKISKPDIDIQQQHIPTLGIYHVQDMTSAKSSLESLTPAPKFMFYQDDAVTLHTGPTGHAMLAHASYIARNSDFFKAALKKDWIEGQTRVIKLPEERPDIVSHYLNYAYSKVLPTVSDSDSTTTPNFNTEQYYELLAELYVLGECLQDHSIRTAVIESSVRSWEHLHSITVPASIIYRGTTAGSPARRLVVDLFLAHGEGFKLDNTCEADFLLDVARAFCVKAETYAVPGSFRDRSLNAADYSS